MKTILELSPKGNTLWTIDDDIYPLIYRALQTERVRSHMYSRSRAISVGEVVKMLPSEMRRGIKSEPNIAKQTQCFPTVVFEEFALNSSPAAR